MTSCHSCTDYFTCKAELYHVLIILCHAAGISLFPILSHGIAVETELYFLVRLLLPGKGPLLLLHIYK